MPEIFTDEPSENCCQILGRIGNRRVYKYVKREYIIGPESFEKYKVFMAGASGSGSIGETLSAPVIGAPLTGSTESFLSVGSFETQYEAESCIKYIKTKFARALLSIFKVTQAITPEKWRMVPLQDFTPSSDIDWSQSVAAIDRQLYKKYGLSPEEIDFIETHVKEMA